MKDLKSLLAVMLFALTKLCRFNAFAGAILGICYGLLASFIDREFLGLGSTQITLLGIGCFFVFFAASIGLTGVGNSLVSETDQRHQ